MEQNKVAESIMVQFQKLDSQEQNKVFRNLYEVTQKTRSQKVDELQQKLYSMQKDMDEMDSVFKRDYAIISSADMASGGDCTLVSYWKSNGKGMQLDPQKDLPFADAGVKSDTLDDRHP